MLAEKEKKRIERAGFNTNRPPYWKIFKEAFPQLFNVFMIFFVTLSVFPAVYSDIKQHDDDFVIPKDIFTTVTCFLTFNLCAMLGSLLTSWVKWVSVCYIFVTPDSRLITFPFTAKSTIPHLARCCSYRFYPSLYLLQLPTTQN